MAKRALAVVLSSALAASVAGGGAPPAAASPSPSPSSAGSDASSPAPTVATPRSEPTWCDDGLEPLDEATCVALPPASNGPLRVLVYLHGIVPPLATSEPKTTVQRTARRAAARAGAALVLPRGVRGIGPAGAQSWYAWPTSPATYAQHAEALVHRFAAARDAASARAGRPAARTYLAGSSNGAYFVAALALRGDLARFGFAVDGVGAMSGGGPSRAAAPNLRGTPPFYVGFGAYDAVSRRHGEALAAQLRAGGAEVRRALHPVGHGTREIYLDEAFAFWDSRARPGDAFDG